MNTAILFDTMSIQQYVFGSNKLKDNLGASYIVEHIYEYLEKKSEDNPKDIEIGYVGGGNALVFTTSKDKAKEIVEEYTTELLYLFPGVSLAVAIKENFRNDEINYSHDIKELFKILAENKGKYMPVNTISSHGITDICRFSSLSVEKIDKYGNLISSSTASKRIHEKIARDQEEELLKEANLDNYCFPDELDDLGQKKGEDSHIAIVHIDGNGFGEVFRNLRSVNATKELSDQVKYAVRSAFLHTLKEYKTYKTELESNLTLQFCKKEDGIKKILPIRPIVLGGDDVTFVCHGKLGIWFAEKFMEDFNSNTFTDVDCKVEQFSCCAGIAIVKTKYPFYRAYQLAEDLCSSAKKLNKEKGGNWIDFQFAYSGLGNTLEEVRKLYYQDLSGINKLHKRPYCIDNLSYVHSFKELKAFADLLLHTLPHSKVKDLREILTSDIESQKAFIEHLKHQHIEFKEKLCYEPDSAEVLLNHPFFDMIELLEIYPTNLLNEE